jgi:glutaredoxin
VIKVELFSSPGCAKCASARAALKEVVESLGKDGVAWREVNVLNELDYAVALGVLTLPTLAINGKLVFSSLPSADQLRNELTKYLSK